jgi:signal peptidase II
LSVRRPLRLATAGTIIAVLAVAVLAVDQFTKYLAISSLPSETLVPVLGDFFGLYLIRNSGAAFSFGAGFTWVFTLALAAVAVVIVVLVRRIRSRAWAVVLGLLLGAVLGNLTDRLFREPGFGVGHVVDFVSTPWMWFWTSPAIYNVADCFIVTMMIAVAILVLIGLRLDGTRETRGRKDAEPVVDAASTEPRQD